MVCRTVAILIFDDIEVLDFAGPYEVFNVTGELQDPTPFRVYTVAETNAPIKTRGNLVVHPNFSIYNLPKVDILIIPGGSGTRALLEKAHLIQWITDQFQQVEILASICTGSMALAKAGLLNGLEVTTHNTCVEELQKLLPTDAKIVRKRYVDHGKILTAGGISDVFFGGEDETYGDIPITLLEMNQQEEDELGFHSSSTQISDLSDCDDEEFDKL
jgi:transcriptional regulator GlxA family with amidase domain